MRTVSVEVFDFSELSPDAQLAVIQRRQSVECELWDATDRGLIGDLCERLALVGFDTSADNVQYSGFYSQGDGACFTGDYSLSADDVDAIRTNIAETYPKDEELSAFFELAASLVKPSGPLTFNLHWFAGHYCHEYSVGINADELDEDSRGELLTACRDIMRAFYRELESDYEYCTGEECAREYLESDGAQYLINGDDFAA